MGLEALRLRRASRALALGLMVTMLLLGAILARNVGLAEKKGDRVIAVSAHSEARTQTTSENGGGATVDFGVADLRGSLP